MFVFKHAATRLVEPTDRAHSQVDVFEVYVRTGRTRVSLGSYLFRQDAEALADEVRTLINPA